ncbi:MAG: hypothetical protein M3R41_10655 [Pseudomonadota bacterium]|nr:hypothetical protein [Pseudomonadota bacterium]
MKPVFLALALPLVIAGCSAVTTQRYPSLLPRAIEARSDAEPIVAPAGPVAADPTLDRDIAAYRATLTGNAAAFTAAADRAEHAARGARGAAVGSEPWIAAQTALAELDGYRATTSATLTDIETSAIARASDAQPAYPALDAAKAEADAMLNDQTARIAAIQALVKPA